MVRVGSSRGSLSIAIVVKLKLPAARPKTCRAHEPANMSSVYFEQGRVANRL